MEKKKWIHQRVMRGDIKSRKVKSNIQRKIAKRPMQDKDLTPIKVYVRVRPFNEQEEERKEISAVEVFEDDSKIKVIDQRHSQETSYFFDGIFSPTDDNKSIYDKVAQPMIVSLLNGCNSALLTYGQTGTGKTFTLMANGSVTHYSIENLFERINKDQKHTYKVNCSFVQVYQDKVYDLLNPENGDELPVREHPKKGIYVARLTQHPVSTSEDVLKHLERGKNELIIAETRMVRHSSRSHSIFQLSLERRLRPISMQNSDNQGCVEPIEGEKQDDGELVQIKEDMILRGKLDICDLAGSERLAKTMAEGVRLSEAKHINSSLLELGNVIYALSEGTKRHVPFRNSTLTRLLQQCLGPKCRTNFIVCVAPSMSESYETRCSLNFGTRARKITNKERMHANVEVDYQIQCRRLSRKIEQLEEELGSLQKQGCIVSIKSPKIEQSCQTIERQTSAENKSMIPRIICYAYLTIETIQSLEKDNFTFMNHAIKSARISVTADDRVLHHNGLELYFHAIMSYPCKSVDHYHLFINAIMENLKEKIVSRNNMTELLIKDIYNAKTQLYGKWMEAIEKYRMNNNEVQHGGKKDSNWNEDLQALISNNFHNGINIGTLASDCNATCCFLHLHYALTAITLLEAAGTNMKQLKHNSSSKLSLEENSAAIWAANESSYETFTLDAISVDNTHDGSTRNLKQTSVDYNELSKDIGQSLSTDVLTNSSYILSNTFQLNEKDNTTFNPDGKLVIYSDTSMEASPEEDDGNWKKLNNCLGQNESDSDHAWSDDDIKTSTQDNLDMDTTNEEEKEHSNELLAKIKFLEHNNRKVTNTLNAVMMESQTKTAKLKETEETHRSTLIKLDQTIHKMKDVDTKMNEALDKLRDQENDIVNYQKQVQELKETNIKEENQIIENEKAKQNEIDQARGRLIMEEQQNKIFKAENELLNNQLGKLNEDIESLQKQIKHLHQNKQTIKTNLKNLIIKGEQIPKVQRKRCDTFRKAKNESTLEIELFIAIEKNLAMEAVITDLKELTNDERLFCSNEAKRKKSKEDLHNKGKSKTTLKRTNSSVNSLPPTGKKSALRRTNSERIQFKAATENESQFADEENQDGEKYPRTTKIKQLIIDNQELIEEKIRLLKREKVLETALGKSNSDVEKLIAECALLEEEASYQRMNGHGKMEGNEVERNVMSLRKRLEEMHEKYNLKSHELTSVQNELQSEKELRKTLEEEKMKLYEETEHLMQKLRKLTDIRIAEAIESPQERLKPEISKIRKKPADGKRNASESKLTNVKKKSTRNRIDFDSPTKEKKKCDLEQRGGMKRQSRNGLCMDLR